MNRSESKYFATAERMDEAFLSLLEEKELPYITVKEICARAGVNRSTFYLHYETVGDLLEESANHLIERFTAHMAQEPAAFIEKIRTCPLEELYLLTSDYLMPYLSFASAHSRLFRAILERPSALRMGEAYDALNRYVFEPILERFGVPPSERRYRMAYHISGLTAIVRLWLEGGCAESVEQIAAVMRGCVGHKP